MQQKDIGEFLCVVAKLAGNLDEYEKGVVEAKLLEELHYNPYLAAYPGNVWADVGDDMAN